MGDKNITQKSADLRSLGALIAKKADELAELFNGKTGDDGQLRMTEEEIKDAQARNEELNALTAKWEGMRGRRPAWMRNRRLPSSRRSAAA